MNRERDKNGANELTADKTGPKLAFDAQNTLKDEIKPYQYDDVGNTRHYLSFQ